MQLPISDHWSIATYM